MATHSFFFDAGARWLDFVNTIVMINGTKGDLLSSLVDLDRWRDEAGWTGTTSHGSLDLEAAHRLRSALRALAERTTRDQALPPSAIDTIDQHLAGTHGAMRIRATDDGYQSTFVAAGTEPPSLVWTLAMDAAHWLQHDDPKRLRRCAHPECVLFFMDNTRNRSRRWCSMKTCGNREKSRAFRRRHPTR